MQDLFKGYGVEVLLTSADDFLKIRETLRRVGIPNHNRDTITQTCHILHKRGRYVIIHFKELFLFDGKLGEFSAEDKSRRDKIVTLLEEWGMLKPVTPDNVEYSKENKSIEIIKHKELADWRLIQKYTFGRK